MQFNKHKDLEGKHSLLSPSTHYWVNYDEAKFERFYINYRNKERGTELHDLACHCIRLGQKLPKTKSTLNMYVNDAIGYRMTPEQVLYYSENCFGTADAIAYRNNFLRIHDLKTGQLKAHPQQLEIYSAIFFLEYRVPLDKTDIELRLYQYDNVIVWEPDKNLIADIMKKIVTFDKQIQTLKGDG